MDFKSISIGAGHAAVGQGAIGAVGYLNESVEDRYVKDIVKYFLGTNGARVVDCTVDRGSQGEVLNSAIAICNAAETDLAIQIHFNAACPDSGDGKQKGCECWVYPTAVKNHNMAEKYANRICEKLEKFGYHNRGVKTSSSLKFLRKTHMPAIIVEVCFVDDKDDADFYLNHLSALGAGMCIASALIDEE